MPTRESASPRHSRPPRGLDWLAIALDHAKPIRISLLVLATAVMLALNVDQVAELFLAAVWTDPNTTRYLALLASSALAGLALWFASRQSYRLIYPRWPALQDPRADWLRCWLPRLLGAAVPMLVLLGYLLALRGMPPGVCSSGGHCRPHSLRTLGLLLEAALLLGFFVWRRPRYALALESRVSRLRELGRLPLSLFVGVLLLNLLATVLVAWQPGLLDGIGPLAIALIAVGFVCMSGGFLCMAADRHGLPLLILLVLLTMLLHGLHLNDNHRVRQYPTMSTHEAPGAAVAETRPDFADYANAWLDSRCRPAQPCPIVMAVAEGGGIRSAAWTALVLSRLTALVQARHLPARRAKASSSSLSAQAAEPLLARYLFAGSGVSGGSLGLASYVALLRQPSSASAAKLEWRAQILLGHDFLAPTLANMFFVDFTQRWLPGAWFDDRARALTRAWEQAAWQQGVVVFAEPFSALYRRADGHVDTTSPALFLNSTTVAQGWRFVQHPFRPFVATPWLAGFDGSSWLDPRLPLSEAVLNSARFTYVSPAGTLQMTPPTGVPAPRPTTLQLVDGGYFEDSGATTMLELMERLRAIARQRGQPLRFIVLHISNDPRLGDFVSAHDSMRPLPLHSTSCPPPENIASIAPSGEATAPLEALLDTRGARGEYARASLLAALHIDATDPARGDMLWHFRLCPGNYPLSLGWTISTPVFDEMRRQLRQHYPLASMAQSLDEQLSRAAVERAAVEP